MTRRSHELSTLSNVPRPVLGDVIRTFGWPELMDGEADAHVIIDRADRVDVPRRSILMSGFDTRMFSTLRESDLPTEAQLMLTAATTHGRRAVAPEWTTKDIDG